MSSDFIFRLYTKAHEYEPYEDFNTLEKAEERRVEIAIARSQGLCKERYCVAFDEMDIVITQ